MNRVNLIGRLTRDPELKNGWLKFGLAVDGSYFKEGQKVEHTHYFNVSKAKGENLAKHLAKGDRVGIDGTLNFHQWEDQNGNKRSAIDIIALQIDFLEPKKDTQEQQQAESYADDNIPF